MEYRKILNLHYINQYLLKFAETLGMYGLKDAEIKRYMFTEFD